MTYRAIKTQLSFPFRGTTLQEMYVKYNNVFTQIPHYDVSYVTIQTCEGISTSKICRSDHC